MSQAFAKLLRVLHEARTSIILERLIDGCIIARALR
jgi:hypothetical protein